MIFIPTSNLFLILSHTPLSLKRANVLISVVKQNAILNARNKATRDTPFR